MDVLFSSYVQDGSRDSSDWVEVSRIARSLLGHLRAPETLVKIRGANEPGRSSADVQATFLAFARQLGFESEKKGLFAAADLRLRPDYYLPLGQTGVLLEVERGKTTINNMDLLDFWKCHLCPEANYLFLMVPQELRQNMSMSPRKEFAAVDRRLSEFFRPANYTTVRGLCLFGY